MAETQQLYQVTTLPGIKRDGTALDGDQCVDGQWVRFQRGRPKKMGGFQLITDRLVGPIRDTLVWSRAAMNAIYNFSTSKIEMILVDNNGLGSSVIDRTPVAFTSDDNYVWSTDTLYNSAGSATAVLAHAAKSMANIDDQTESLCYYGDASGNAAFTDIGAIGPSGTGVSGGMFCVPPYAFFIGSDGYIQWSDANQPTVLDAGDAGDGRITGAKLVRGLPLRSGAGPGGLLWSLDSVIRMDYAGGVNIFKFSHLSTQTSVLSQNSIIEYDGAYYWLGVDRFLVCDGGRVQELPNQMNVNWFFDNLNYEQRQKVWAMKIPRFGEIHWFFPYGDATECTHAVIYNTREQVWYDNTLARGAGYYSQVFRYPVMTAATPTATEVGINLGTVTGTFSVGDTVIGATSGTTGVIAAIIGTVYYVNLSNPNTEFILLEGIDDTTSSASATITLIVPLYSAFLHEKGLNAVVGESTSAIESYFTTADFGLPTGGAKQNDITGLDRWTRLTRVEPDFLQEGEMSVEVLGKEFANTAETTSAPYIFDSTTGKIDMREQRREIRLKFTSNTTDGYYEMGRVILHTKPGDVRS